MIAISDLSSQLSSGGPHDNCQMPVAVDRALNDYC